MSFPTRDRALDARRAFLTLVAPALCALQSCASSPGLRAVVSDGPEPVTWTRVERAVEQGAAPAPDGCAGCPVEAAVQRVPMTDLWRAAGSAELLGSGLTQLDAARGPVDLGYPLLVDLGAGDAPYDDGVAPLDADGLGRSGFSDSVMRFTWREWFAPSAAFTGGAAFLRNQDATVLEGLSDTRFGFVVVGLELQL
ncbi:MAG: hypothetical protein AAFZ87_16740 [Planctomycetota bacterium]